MDRETTVICDQCGNDLTYTGNCEDWRLVLTYESKEPWYRREGLRGGIVTDMAISPPVDRTYIFCGVGCLGVWLHEKKPWYAKDYERNLKHQEFLRKQAVPLNSPEPKE